jgi:hypothetical protein
MPKPKIIITDWAKRQHFKDREPIWIKLYREMRHDRRWRQLSGDACKLYVDLNLLAAEEEPFGNITLYPEDLAWEVRLTLPELILLLAEVDASGLVVATGYHADIKRISSRHQDDAEVLSLTRSREVEAEEEVEVEKETTLANTGMIEVPRSSFAPLPGEDPTPEPDRVPHTGYDEQWVHLDHDELVLFCSDFGIPIEQMNNTLKSLGASEILEA